MKLGFDSKEIRAHEQAQRLKKAHFYISGKITGLDDLNRPKFSATENWLYFKYGTETRVINPHKLPHLHDKSYNSYMREDLRYLLKSTAVVLLDDWMQSKGAIIESMTASFVGIPCYMVIKDDLVEVKTGFWKKIYLLVKLLLKFV